VVVAALGTIRIQAVLEALAVVPQEIILPLQITVLLTQVVAAAQDRRLAVEPAAPASSSSSTTSALPQSSPSSHRRSGLHQRVR
jgi:hypothetical protein